MKTLSSSKLTQIQKNLLILSSMGGTLEFLDFTIYALFARYFSQSFFPNENILSSLLNTFAVFAVGYFARPLGGIIFGHFGDKYGRKTAFTASAFIMALSTLMMGCLPTYSQIGNLAPLLLIFFRLLQGISVGGEIPGATVFISEHFPRHKHGFAIGLIFMGVTLGNVIGSSLGYFLTHFLSVTTMLEWGWRIPFIAGFFLGLVAYILRKKAIETPAFLEMLQEKKTHHLPIITAIKTTPLQLLIGISLTALSAFTIFIFLYLPSYLPILHNYKPSYLYFMIGFSFFILALFTWIFGMISDYLGRTKLMILGSTIAIVFGYVFFMLLLRKPDDMLVIFCIGLALIAAMVNGCYGTAIIELFQTHVRYTGMGIAYNIGFALFGGFATFLITALLKWTHNPMMLYYTYLASALITFIGILFSSIVKPCYSKKTLPHI